MSKVWTIYRKELLDILRDRRTIISMVVIPIVLFPAMTIGFSALVSMQLKKSQAEIQKISVDGAENFPELLDRLEKAKELEVAPSTDYRLAITQKKLSAAIVIPDSADLKIQSGDSAEIDVYFDAAEVKSEFAKDKVLKILSEFADSIIAKRLETLGAKPEMLRPLPIKSHNIASEEKMSGFVLAIFLPYMIIILTMIGATYPAIDLTAGEKERGTLETILASPASRFDIAAGKFLTIFTASIITALLSVTSLTATIGLGIASFAEMGQSPIAFRMQPLAFVVLVILMIPVSCLFSSVLMTISLFAKSYKEAQSYITPAMFVVILPAMVSFIPGVELDFKLSIVPIVNVSLVAKEALMGNFRWGYLVSVFLSTALLASIAVFVAKRQFEREEVLFRI
ncbi:MAG: hypothetical protein CO189_12310 [candidate division Zixibacteria bacterium CG_4_9_14_3_um_filter_46_8]|nr:MAG: hypothetical protein CO189_12310 [candidate division Zixibacteria bacterium CG_4_9_14_3_um_filter_46_8]